MDAKDEDDVVEYRDLTIGIPRDCIVCDASDCLERAPEKRCSRCRTVYYCSAACQKANWRQHQPYCINICEMRSKLEEPLPPLDRSLLDMHPAPVDPEMNCPICFEHPMDDPVTMQECQHSFCTQCIIEWQRQSKSKTMIFSDNAAAPCPVCRGKTKDIEVSLWNRASLLAGQANICSMLEETKRELRIEALKCLDQLLEIPAPDTTASVIQARITKAEILVQLQDGEAAAKTIDKVLDILQQNQDHPLLQAMRKQEAAEKRGDIKESERWTKEAMRLFDLHGSPTLALHPSSLIHLHLQHSEALELAGDLERALGCYQTAFRLIPEPNSADAVLQRKLFMGMARVAYCAKRYGMAISASECAIEMNRHFDEVHKYKALSLKAIGKLDEAVEIMNQAVLYETPWKNENRQKALELYRELLAEQQKVTAEGS